MNLNFLGAGAAVSATGDSELASERLFPGAIVGWLCRRGRLAKLVRTYPFAGRTTVNFLSKTAVSDHTTTSNRGHRYLQGPLKYGKLEIEV